MSRECLFPNVTKSDTCNVESLFGDHGMYICCKGCANSVTPLEIMAMLPDLDADKPIADPRIEGLVENLRERDIATEPSDDSYPFVNLIRFNLLRVYQDSGRWEREKDNPQE